MQPSFMSGMCANLLCNKKIAKSENFGTTTFKFHESCGRVRMKAKRSPHGLVLNSQVCTRAV